MKLNKKSEKTDNLTCENKKYTINKAGLKLSKEGGKSHHKEDKNKKVENKEELIVNKGDDIVVKRQVLRRKKKPKKPNRLLVFAQKHGKTKIEIRGQNAHRVLTNLSCVTPLTHVESLDGKVTFFVNSKHCDKIVAILHKLCYDYKIIEIIGAVPSFARTLVRIGAIAGMIVCTCALGMYPCFITKVSVSGDFNAQVDGVLESYGVYEGRFAPSLDTQRMEDSLLSLDGVAFASVRRQGAHVEVYVKSELPNDSFVDVKSKPIVSKKRATVTRVIVRGGTALVKYGDVVQEGDTIVDGYVTYGDDKIDAVADGEAYGRVYYQKTLFFANEYFERTYGETKTVTRLSMFGKSPTPPTSPFEVYECATSVQKLGFLLPIEIHRYEFRQLTVTKKQNTLDEDAMKNKVYASVLEEFETATVVENVYWQIEKETDGTRVSVTVQAEEKIT